MYADNTVYTEDYKGYTIKIMYDDVSNYDFDELAGETYPIKIVCWHNRYDLGNTGNKYPYDTPENFNDWLKDNPSIVYPLWLYDHSGISIKMGLRTYPYNDAWDSGQVGYVVFTLEDIRKEFSCKHVSPRIRGLAIKSMEGLINAYDDYLRGYIYGYIVEDSKGENLDSCWGFLGDYEDSCLPDARSVVDYYVKNDNEAAWLKVNNLVLLAD